MPNLKKLDEDNDKIVKLSEEIAKFYDMPEETDLVEITEKVINSPLVNDSQKQVIKKTKRKIYVFVYPSNGLKVKGVISFIPHLQNVPLLINLRGGNKFFGVTNPGNQFVCPNHNLTVLMTTYRDGVSEGIDEYGGADVNDVKNLIDFIPLLEKKLNISIENPKTFMLGASRGGMEMFLFLSRYPEYQSRLSKIVSLSGLLDLREAIKRIDLKEMFVKDFGLNQENEDNWLDIRNPVLTVDSIKEDLPILIIQGTDDMRTSLEHGYHMVSALEEGGKDVTYWEIEGAEHCLMNISKRSKIIIDWLEG